MKRFNKAAAFFMTMLMIVGMLAQNTVFAEALADTVEESTEETADLVDESAKETFELQTEEETELDSGEYMTAGDKTEEAEETEETVNETAEEIEKDMSRVTWDDVPSMGWDDPEQEKCEEKNAKTEMADNGIALFSSTEQRMIKAYGIDVSSHNKTIDWKKVKEAGVDFAIIRVGGRGYSEGTIYKDDYAKENIEGALAAGIQVGVYFFSTALNEKEAVEEAKYTCSVIKDYNITYPVVYDHEGYDNKAYRNYGLSNAVRTKSAIAFLEYVEELGYKGMMYSSANHLRNNDSWDTDALEKSYDIWMAQYWLDADSHQFSSYEQAENKPSSYEGTYRIWQFTSEGRVNGISDSYVDMDVEYYAEGENITELSAPEVYSVQNVSGGVKVSWRRVPGAAGYYVYRKDNDGNYSRIGQISGGRVLDYTDITTESGVTYTYTVLAYAGSIKSSYDSEVSVLYLKDPDITEVRAVTGGIRVTWETIPGAENYVVYRKVNSGSWQRLAVVNGQTAVMYTDAEVSSGTSYTYTVRACAGKAMSSYQSQANIIYLREVKVTGAAAVSGGVKVNWEDVPGAEGYYIYRKNNGNSYSRVGQVSGGSTLSYIDAGVQSGIEYTYTVLAYSGGSKSYFNSQASILYLKDPNVTGVSAVSDSVKVTWESIDGAEGYNIYRKTNGGNWVRIARINGKDTVSYTDTEVSSGKNYTYTVRAYAGNAMSSYKSQKNIIYMSVPVISGTTGSSNGIKVTWKKVGGATGYIVYRKTSGSSWSRIAKISGGSTLYYTDTNVISGKTYIYTVRACNGSFMSDYNRTGVSGKFTQTLVKYQTTENVNYRSGPGTSYSKEGSLKKETTVQIVSGYSVQANGYTWYKMYLNGKYYYIAGKYLKKV